MNKQEILQGDCLELMKNIPDESIDAVITDPPYELGFMGKSWDKTGIANNVEMWKECLRVLKPGGNLLAFSGTRTYHRMASAIENAGFEVRDMIEWVYGSGFPKSLNIGKAVDRLQGNEREVVGKNPNFRPVSGKEGYLGQSNFRQTDGMSISTKGTSEWEGWGTALKPAHEPICMARKPLSEKTVAENCLKWGTGGINIDESRVGEEERSNPQAGFIRRGRTDEEVFGGADTNRPEGEITVSGRFPANLIHDNSEEVRECFPETKSVKVNNVHRKDCPNTAMSGRNYARFNEEEGYNDSGNASRFFKSIIYQPKASKSDRGEENNHATVKPVKLMEYLINMVTTKEGIILDPFAGSGTTGVACKNLNRQFILIEKEPEYVEIIRKRLN